MPSSSAAPATGRSAPAAMCARSTRPGAGSAAIRDLPAVFFREEYELIRRIHHFPKPYIAVIDGITMGGGAGISVNGAYRIATERTLFAMPETGIGLFPDVGATRFLNRCPGHVGRYLGLTGARLNAADALYCGFATHAVETVGIDALFASWRSTAGLRACRVVEACLGRFAVDPGPGPARRVAAGDRPMLCRRTMSRRSSTRSPPRRQAAATTPPGPRRHAASLLTKSPTSLKITLRQLTIGRDYDLEAALVARIPADPACHGRARFLRRRAGDADRQGPEAALAPGDIWPRSATA